MAVRPIDANSLLDELTQIAHGMGRISIHISDMVKVMTRVVERQTTLTPPNDWVSADERLPENYTDVLCWYEYFRHGDYNRMYQTYGIGYCINGQWGGEVSNGTKCKVLYWQPMPAPPDRRLPEGEEDT